MIRTEKVGEIFYPGIDTEFDSLGIADEFSIRITEASTDNEVQNSVPNAFFNEIIKNVPSKSCEVLETSLTGRKTFKTINNTFEVGDSFEHEGIFYTVSKISSTETITLHRTLKSDLLENTILNNVGNTGVYKIPVQIDQTGFYFITIYHKTFGHIAIKYKIVNSNVQDLMTEIIEIKNKLNEKNVGFL